MRTFADKVIDFNKQLVFRGKLPGGISIMNPFRENKDTITISSAFYKKFYNDHEARHLILGINPGRFGAGITGVPFTDPKRLKSECEIPYPGKETHEPSSVFVYEMINALGGVKKFYKNFYVNSVCPLGFTAINAKGKEINHNYYDSKELTASVNDFIIQCIQKQIALGIETDICFCFGNGKNKKFILELNRKEKFFKKIIALEHPRYIMQYKAKTKQFYIDKYISAFSVIKL
jgi:uracil DNA glycosylase superfamily protein